MGITGCGDGLVRSMQNNIILLQDLLCVTFNKREKQANYSDLVVIFVQHEFNGAAVVPIYLQCDFAVLRIVANHRHIY